MGNLGELWSREVFKIVEIKFNMQLLKNTMLKFHLNIRIIDPAGLYE